MCSCAEVSESRSVVCKSQESKLAVLWTLGIFALNFGPVLVGPVLDRFGPKITAIFGEALPPSPHLLIFRR